LSLTPLKFFNIIQGGMSDELVLVSLFLMEARHAVASLFGGAKFSFGKKIILRTNYSEVK